MPIISIINILSLEVGVEIVTVVKHKIKTWFLNSSRALCFAKVVFEPRLPLVRSMYLHIMTTRESFSVGCCVLPWQKTRQLNSTVILTGTFEARRGCQCKSSNPDSQMCAHFPPYRQPPCVLKHNYLSGILSKHGVQHLPPFSPQIGLSSPVNLIQKVFE